MIRHRFAFIVGIVVGVVVFGMAIYYFYRSQKINRLDKNADAHDTNAEGLTKAKDKNIDELLSNQAFVENLTGNELTGWFKKNIDSFPDTIKMVIAIPTEETLKGLGYSITEKIDPEKNIIQFFYDDIKKEVVKIRLVSFININSNLQAHLIEENGLILVTS